MERRKKKEKGFLMSLYEAYKRHMRHWQRYKYEQTGNETYVWLSIAFDIMLVAFLIYFIWTVNGNLSMCFKELEKFTTPGNAREGIKYLTNMTGVV